eukprot:6288959-Prymnesium_polylepis.1
MPEHLSRKPSSDTSPHHVPLDRATTGWYSTENTSEGGPVVQLLRSRSWQDVNVQSYKGLCARLRLIQEMGMPPMR